MNKPTYNEDSIQKLKNISGIYAFKNKINGKYYIGSSIDIYTRYKQHLYRADATHTNKGQYPLYQAIRKYGINNFEFFILEIFNDTNDLLLRQKERDYIIKYNSVAPNGYNQTDYTEHPSKDKYISNKISKTKRNNAKMICELNDNGEIVCIWNCAKDCEEETGIDCRRLGECCNGRIHKANDRIFRWYVDEKIIIPTFKGKEISANRFSKRCTPVKQIDCILMKSFKFFLVLV